MCNTKLKRKEEEKSNSYKQVCNNVGNTKVHLEWPIKSILLF